MGLAQIILSEGPSTAHNVSF